MPNLLSRTAAFASLICPLALLMQAQTAAEPTTAGRVEFDIDYEDLGALGAMMPKKQTLSFRAGQRRIEMGGSVTLIGVEPGKQIQLMDFGGKKVAFVLPEESDLGAAASDLRREQTDRRELVAGLSARAVDLVDVLDPSNRLPLPVTDQIATTSSHLHSELEGFALDYYQPIQDGLGHWRAQRAEAEKLDPALFTIPADYQRIELPGGAQPARTDQSLACAPVQAGYFLGRYATALRHRPGATRQTAASDRRRTHQRPRSGGAGALFRCSVGNWRRGGGGAVDPHRRRCRPAGLAAGDSRPRPAALCRQPAASSGRNRGQDLDYGGTAGTPWTRGRCRASKAASSTCTTTRER